MLWLVMWSRLAVEESITEGSGQKGEEDMGGGN